MTIERTKVEEAERLGFLPNHLGRNYLGREMAFYQRMQGTVPEYNGGSWEFYTLSNGGWYMAPLLRQEQVEMVVSINGYRGKMSPDAAGLVVSLFVLNMICWDDPSDAKNSDRFYALKDYALEHPEMAEIIRAID